jgi:hypothetical protein
MLLWEKLYKWQADPCRFLNLSGPVSTHIGECLWMSARKDAIVLGLGFQIMDNLSQWTDPHFGQRVVVCSFLGNFLAEARTVSDQIVV